MKFTTTPKPALVLASREPIDAAKAFTSGEEAEALLQRFVFAMAGVQRLHGNSAYARVHKLPMMPAGWPELTAWLSASWGNYQWAVLFTHALGNQCLRLRKPSRYVATVRLLTPVPPMVAQRDSAGIDPSFGACPFTFNLRPVPKPCSLKPLSKKFAAKPK